MPSSIRLRKQRKGRLKLKIGNGTGETRVGTTRHETQPRHVLSGIGDWRVQLSHWHQFAGMALGRRSVKMPRLGAKQILGAQQVGSTSTCSAHEEQLGEFFYL